MENFKPMIIYSKNNLLESQIYLGAKESDLKNNGFVFSGSPEDYYFLNKKATYKGFIIEYECFVVHYKKVVSNYSVTIKMNSKFHELFPKIDTINIYKKGENGWYHMKENTYMEAFRWIDLRGSKTEKYSYELQFITTYNPNYFNYNNLRGFENYYNNPSVW